MKEVKKFIEENEETCDICADCASFSEADFSREKILVPLLVWGPNNQIQGFRFRAYILLGLYFYL